MLQTGRPTPESIDESLLAEPLVERLARSKGGVWASVAVTLTLVLVFYSSRAWSVPEKDVVGQWFRYNILFITALLTLLALCISTLLYVLRYDMNRSK